MVAHSLALDACATAGCGEGLGGFLPCTLFCRRRAGAFARASPATSTLCARASPGTSSPLRSPRSRPLQPSLQPALERAQQPALYARERAEEPALLSFALASLAPPPALPATRFCRSDARRLRSSEPGDQHSYARSSRSRPLQPPLQPASAAGVCFCGLARTYSAPPQKGHSWTAALRLCVSSLCRLMPVFCFVRK
jgi:hypothetical protein